MKLKPATSVAALAFAAAVALSPVAASASSYTPLVGPGTVETPVVAPGGVVPFDVTPGIFQPGEPVTVTLSGENASGATLLAFVKTAYEVARLGTMPAPADGSFNARVRMPANASGAYTLLATSPSVPGGVSATFSVATGGGTDPAGGGLPVTGMDSGALLALWVGGGALVLAGGAVAVGAAVHRRRKQSA